MRARRQADRAGGPAHPSPAVSAKGAHPSRDSVELIWHKSWRGQPIPARDDCHHGSSDVLAINQRLEPSGKGQRLAADGALCMCCGADGLGRLTLVEGLERCWDEHGWNHQVGLRLYELAVAHKAELMTAPLLPIWMFSAFGCTGQAIAQALADQDAEAAYKGTVICSIG